MRNHKYMHETTIIQSQVKNDKTRKMILPIPHLKRHVKSGVRQIAHPTGAQSQSCVIYGWAAGSLVYSWCEWR